MSQPKWKCIAQLGDASPTEYGGYWVFVDETGVYPPEAEWLDCPDEDLPTGYTAYRFILEPCTYINGVLSDNKYHPESAAWFAKPESERAARPQDTTYLDAIVQALEVPWHKAVEMFCSSDPVQRAWAWRAVGQTHGFINLDTYPMEMTRKEVKARYKTKMYKVAEKCSG